MKPVRFFKSVVTMNLIALSAFAGQVPTPLQKGGVSGGGGDLNPAVRVSKAEVRNFLDARVKDDVKSIFTAIEALMTKQDLPSEDKEIRRKLFSGSKTVYQSIQDAVIEPLENGACVDPITRKPKDAAYNNNKVCFSLERITNRVHSLNYVQAILALASHEISHGAGLTEKEAYSLQLRIESSLPKMHFYSVLNQKMGFHRQIQIVEDTLKPFLTNLIKGEALACARLGTFRGFASDLLGTVSTGDALYIGLLPVSSRGALSTLVARMHNLTQYCFPAPQLANGNEGASMDEVFNNQAEMDVVDYIRRVYVNVDLLPTRGTMIRRIHSFNKDALYSELQEILKLLAEIKAKKL
ncbi:MAG: hypothetical protein AB7F59_00335 [Bdellovibrionales bacterium]